MEDDGVVVMPLDLDLTDEVDEVEVELTVMHQLVEHEEQHVMLIMVRMVETHVKGLHDEDDDEVDIV